MFEFQPLKLKDLKKSKLLGGLLGKGSSELKWEHCDLSAESGSCHVVGISLGKCSHNVHVRNKMTKCLGTGSCLFYFVFKALGG